MIVVSDIWQSLCSEANISDARHHHFLADGSSTISVGVHVFTEGGIRKCHQHMGIGYISFRISFLSLMEQGPIIPSMCLHIHLWEEHKWYNITWFVFWHLLYFPFYWIPPITYIQESTFSRVGKQDGIQQETYAGLLFSRQRVMSHLTWDQFWMWSVSACSCHTSKVGRYIPLNTYNPKIKMCAQTLSQRIEADRLTGSGVLSVTQKNNVQTRLVHA